MQRTEYDPGVGLAFAKGEKGWWNDELYESLLAANVWTPAVNPDGWKKIT